MIYFAKAEGLNRIKIGFTDNDDAQTRVDQLQIGSPMQLRLIGTMPGTREDEKNLHRRFNSSHIHGEWFTITPELLALIPANGFVVSDSEFVWHHGFQNPIACTAGEWFERGSAIWESRLVTCVRLTTRPYVGLCTYGDGRSSYAATAEEGYVPDDKYWVDLPAYSDLHDPDFTLRACLAKYWPGIFFEFPPEPE